MSDTVARETDTGEFWTGEIVQIEHEMSVVTLKYNEFKAQLTFARGRHRQTVGARQVAVQGNVDPVERAELLRSQDDPVPQGPLVVKGQMSAAVVATPAVKKARNGFFLWWLGAHPLSSVSKGPRIVFRHVSKIFTGSMSARPARASA